MDFQFFHRPKPRKFNYKPRFYDAEKDQSGDKDEDRSERFERRLHSSLSEKRNARPAESFWVPILKMGIVIALIVYFISSDIIDNFAKHFLTPRQTTSADFDPQAGFAEEFATVDTSSVQDTTQGLSKQEDDGVYLNGK